MRLSSVLAFALMIVLGCGVYNVANRYEKTEKKLRAVQNKIEGEEEALRVLQAEWTFLTSPDRLERISAEYLNLQAVDGRQYVALNTIPMRADLDAQLLENAAPDDIAEPEAQIASAEMSKPKVDTDNGEAFQKVLAKELAPIATALPRPVPLPRFKAISVNLSESAE